MGLQEQFESRSGRVIAALRAVLAFVFFIALLLEPNVGGSLHLSRILVGGYFVFSLALIPIAWRSWWFDYRLARPVLFIDIFVFLAAVYLTESSDADFTSPFLAIFALTVISAMLRWGWSSAAQIGVTVICLYVTFGMVVSVLDLPLDQYQFARRAFYMAALLLVLVWIGIQRREPLVPPLSATLDEADFDALLWRAISYARGLTGAGRGVLVWEPQEEPWVLIRADGPEGRRAERSWPDNLPGWDDQGREARLFDSRRRRKLVLDHDNLPRITALRTPVPLPAWVDLAEGIALPLHGASGTGLLVLGDIPGAGHDQLLVGKALSREIGNALDRAALARLERTSLVARTRGAVARDLHDSVAQSLAGACFRLEALRRQVGGSNEPSRAEAVDLEIVAVRDALRREQGHVRSLIRALREPGQIDDERDLRGDMNAVLRDAGAHWNVAVTLDAAGAVPVPAWLSHEVQQLAREAVANAARHGKAGRISVRIVLADGWLKLHIADDGAGFSAATPASDPWSISERVRTLRGELGIDSGPDGTRLAISLPVTRPFGAS